jgi:hypothetical protein
MFSELSVSLTKQLSKEIKKEQGIYFTPNKIVEEVCEFVLDKKLTINTVLEPSCGSGQFLEYLVGKNVTAIENNEIIYNATKEKFPYIIHGDFLEHNFENRFDVVIGNPPYFTIQKKMVNKKYYPFFEGRPNIYILFILKSFELLNEEGILAFVLPTNFLNCIYYNELRKYLSKYTILKITLSNEKFIETSQEICVFIIQKKLSLNQDYKIWFNDIVLFKQNEHIVKINKLKENTTTLNALGCKLNIGTVVWNECKQELTNDNSKPLLIYSGDIKNNILDIQGYNNSLKKNYINKTGCNDTVILVNRGYGTGKYNFNYCFIDSNDPKLKNGYLVENHCIVIHSNEQTLKIIIHSFKNKKTKEFIDLVFSNNAINIHEFLYIFPIFV